MSQNRRVKTPRERRRQKLLFWIGAGLLVAYDVLGGDYKLHHLVFLASEKDRVAGRIEQLESENAVLASQERRLQGDSLLLERLAREKGMKKKGEIIYRLVPITPGGSGGQPRAEPDSAVPASPPVDAGAAP